MVFGLVLANENKKMDDSSLGNKSTFSIGNISQPITDNTKKHSTNRNGEINVLTYVENSRYLK